MIDYPFKLGRRQRPPDPREWRHRLLVPGAVDRTQPRSLASFFPAAALNQGGEGSCTAFSSVAVQMACAAIGGQQATELSEEQLYYLERVKEGTFPQDVGAYTADSVDCVLQNGGLVANATWPYDANPAETPPAGVAGAPKYLYVSGHQPVAAADFLDGVLVALDAKQPLLLALDWYEDFFSDYQNSGVLSLHAGDQIAGGHQLAVTGYTPSAGGLVRCRNSWGATSPARTDLLGDSISGDVWLPVSMLTNGVVLEVRAVTPAVAPAPTPTPTPPAPEQLQLSINVPAGAQPGQAVTVRAQVSGAPAGDAVVVFWDWGDGTANGAGMTAAHVYQTAGTYTVRGLARDTVTGAQSAIQSAQLVVAAQPPPARTIVSAAIALSDGTTVKLP